MTTVRWDDDALRKAVRQAAAKGLNRVAADCVRDAKDNVPVVTGTLDGSIQVWEPAQPGSIRPGAGSLGQCRRELRARRGAGRP